MEIDTSSLSSSDHSSTVGSLRKIISFSIFGGWIDGEREELMDRKDEDQFLEVLYDSDRYAYNPESAVHIHMYDLF